MPIILLRKFLSVLLLVSVAAFFTPFAVYAEGAAVESTEESKDNTDESAAATEDESKDPPSCIDTGECKKAETEKTEAATTE